MKIFHLISFRIFIIVIVILSSLSITVSYFQLKEQSSRYVEWMTECADRTSNMVRASTRHSMMLNRDMDTFTVLKHFRTSGTIEKIRLIDKKGTIVFSSDSSEILTKVNLKNEACYTCHTSSGETIHETTVKENRRIYTDAKGVRHMGFVTPVHNEEGCYTADCHVHSADVTVLGVFDILVSLENSDQMLAEERVDMIGKNIAITLILALTVGIFIWIVVHIPLNKFLLGTKEISSGNLNHQINIKSKDEIGRFAISFNKMTNDLKHAKREITEWSEELERRVKQKTEELQSTQNRILQIEKLASLGKLSATVAHELNNPMAGILTTSKLIQKKIDKMNGNSEKLAGIIRQLAMIESESSRCGNIIKDLLLFSREQRTELKPHQINDIIVSSFQLVSHHLKLHNITLNKELQADLPVISVDENQVKQMLLALYVNAVEAMDTGGNLTVSSQYNSYQKSVMIKVKDDGKGIPDEIKENLFEPFFTTKNSVKGSGLGLSVVYGIVNTHSGEITVESKPGQGATFIIKLPLEAKPKPHEKSTVQ